MVYKNTGIYRHVDGADADASFAQKIALRMLLPFAISQSHPNILALQSQILLPAHPNTPNRLQISPLNTITSLLLGDLLCAGSPACQDLLLDEYAGKQDDNGADDAEHKHNTGFPSSPVFAFALHELVELRFAARDEGSIEGGHFV